MQHKLSIGKLLDANGNLSEAGYATSLVKTYDRRDIKTSAFRIKEWDYYYIGDENNAIALTVADNGYMSLVSTSHLDFNAKSFTTDSVIAPFSMGKLGLPTTSTVGDIEYHAKSCDYVFANDGATRRLTCRFDNWGKDKKHFSCDFTLTDFPTDSMVIATPFAKPAHFYYNQKINCMRAVGSFSIDGVATKIDGFATLDWGRGVWTYKNTWYWGSMSSAVDGVPFGFNIGYGFGDTSAASENMLFYNGRAHKLEGVTFNIPKKNGVEDYLSPWTFTSTDGRFEMDFRPLIDRADKMDVGLIGTDQHQVFGRFYGTAILDDGKKIVLDGQIGFAEKVYNKW